jgi:O-antigen ligase
MKKFSQKMLNISNYIFAATMLFSHVGGYVAVGFGFLFSFNVWKKLFREKVFVWMLAFIAYGLIISPFSTLPSAGYSAMLGYFSQWLLPFMLGYSITTSKHFRNAVEVFISVFLVILTLSTLAYFGFFPKEIGQGNYLVNAQDGLLKGLRSHIAFAALCVLFSFISLGKALVKGNNTQLEKWVYIMLAVFPLGVLFLTGSRGYYFAAFMAYTIFGIYWIAKTGKAKIFFIVALGALLAGTAFYLALPGLRNRINSTGMRDASLTERISLYKVALAEIKSKPVFGVGPGQGTLNPEYFKILPPEQQAVSRYGHLHSFYLHITAEMGFVGLAFFCVIIFLILKKLYSAMDTEDGILKALAFGVFWGFIGILFGDLFDTLLKGPGTAMELFWLTGLVFGRLTWGSDNNED